MITLEPNKLYKITNDVDESMEFYAENIDRITNKVLIKVVAPDTGEIIVDLNKLETEKNIVTI